MSLIRGKIVSLAVITLLFVLPLGASAAANDIVFSEIMYNLAGADTDHEWIEIYNSGSETVTIVDGVVGDNSWRFNESSNPTSHTLTLIQGSLVIPPGGVVVLTDNNAVFMTDHPGFSGTVVDTVMSLSNISETLKLSADKGTTFFGEFTYQNTWGGNEDGKSLEKINLSGNNEQSNWRASATDGGTPGVVDTMSSSTDVSSDTSTSTPSSTSSESSVAVSGGGSGISVGTSTPALALKAVAGSDVVAEVNQIIKFDASKSEGASSYKWYLGDGSVKEGTEINYGYQFSGTYLVTLEVSNNSEIALDQIKVSIFGGKAVINEVFVSEASTTPSWIEIFNPTKSTLDIGDWILENRGKKFIFPPFSVITAGGYFVISQQISSLDVQIGSVKLKYPNDLIMDEVIFEKIQLGSSASRTSNGFFWTKEITPGSANIVTSSGSALLENIRAVPNLVATKPDNLPTKNYLASFYSQVEASNQENGELAQKQKEENSFWSKFSSGLLFWVVAVMVLGLGFGLFYIRLTKKRQ